MKLKLSSLRKSNSDGLNFKAWPNKGRAFFTRVLTGISLIYIISLIQIVTDMETKEEEKYQTRKRCCTQMLALL